LKIKWSKGRRLAHILVAPGLRSAAEAKIKFSLSGHPQEMHGSSTGFQQAGHDPSDNAFNRQACMVLARYRLEEVDGTRLEWPKRTRPQDLAGWPRLPENNRTVNVAMSRHLADIVRSFKNYKALGDVGLAQMPEEHLHTELDPNSKRLAVIVKHVGGNLRSRFRDFLTTDGEKPDRNRDGELENASPMVGCEILPLTATSQPNARVAPERHANIRPFRGLTANRQAGAPRCLAPRQPVVCSERS
jgi:hypothetical protein